MVVHTGHPSLRELTHEPHEFKASPDCRVKPTEKAKENEIPKHQSRQISHDSFQISGKVNFHYVQFDLGVPRNSDVLISGRFRLSGWVLFTRMSQTGHKKIDVRAQEVAEPVIGHTLESFSSLTECSWKAQLFLEFSLFKTELWDRST